MTREREDRRLSDVKRFARDVDFSSSVEDLVENFQQDGRDDEFQRLRPIRAASWNVSAVNTNPFEYWVTHADPDYNMLMTAVQNFIDNPEQDIAVMAIFTETMYLELKSEMQEQKMTGLDELDRFWTEEYRSRKAITGFLKNSVIGVKRLVSLPDRITNTIYLSGGGVCLRPTVINAYDVPLSSIEEWWRLWRDFMFRTEVQVSLSAGPVR